MNKPNFLIISPPKSGTTALTNYLRQHKDIFMPYGEPHFFSQEKFYNGELKNYLDLFTVKDKDKNPKIYGEKSPSYGQNVNAPKVISKLFPEIKLIWIFREPANRMYSEYWTNISKGMEKRPIDIIFRKNKNPHLTEGSLYIEHVENYLKYFDRKQMKFIIFEEFIKDIDGHLREIYKFLGVDQEFKITEKKHSRIVYPKRMIFNWFLFSHLGIEKSRTRLPKNYPIAYLIAKCRKLNKMLFGRHYKSFIYFKIRALLHYFHMINKMKEGFYPKITENFKKELMEYFEPYNKKLEELIGLKVCNLWN